MMAFFKGSPLGSFSTVPANEALDGFFDSLGLIWADTDATNAKVHTQIVAHFIRIRLYRREGLIEEVCPVQGVALHRLEPGVADNPTEFFFRGAIGDTRGPHNVLFEHNRADVVTAETQAHLADLQALGYPARLHIPEVREVKSRDRQHFQVLDSSGFVPVPAAQCGVRRLETPGNKRREAAGFFLEVVEALEVVHAVIDFLSYAEHHCGSGAHAELMGSAVHADPVFRQAFQASDLVANLVVEDLGASAGDRV